MGLLCYILLLTAIWKSLRFANVYDKGLFDQIKIGKTNAFSCTLYYTNMFTKWGYICGTLNEIFEIHIIQYSNKLILPHKATGSETFTLNIPPSRAFSIICTPIQFKILG